MLLSNWVWSIFFHFYCCSLQICLLEFRAVAVCQPCGLVDMFPFPPHHGVKGCGMKNRRGEEEGEEEFGIWLQLQKYLGPLLSGPMQDVVSHSDADQIHSSNVMHTGVYRGTCYGGGGNREACKRYFPLPSVQAQLCPVGLLGPMWEPMWESWH